MESIFEQQVQRLYEAIHQIMEKFSEAQGKDPQAKLLIPQDFKEDFFSLVDKVNLSLLEDKDNFYGYFLMQMSREIRFDIGSPTAVNFKGAKYVIHFNPFLFLGLNLKQMESTIKHEILHILSGHLIRAQEYKGRYNKLAINMAMNIVVNSFLDYLPPYSVTLEYVNKHYSLMLLPFKPFEYYMEELQKTLDLLDTEEVAESEKADDYAKPSEQGEKITTEYDPAKTHELWEESSAIDEQTLQDFTEKFVSNAQKGSVPNYLNSILSALRNSKEELPWNLYLKRLMGSVESDRKKTVTRRNRRQPERLDLRGELRSHKAKILVALDISGSISDEEFNQALQEVLAIVKNYKHEITLVECDNEIRRIYTIKTVKDIKNRLNTRGGTQFSPVFAYANQHKFNLLIYFTDGKGEEKLQTIPRGYKTLWVISGRGQELSLKEPHGAVKKLKKVEVKDDSLSMGDVKTEGFSMQDQERLYT